MRRYSSKSFLTLTPSPLLRQYFESRNQVFDFPWDEEYEPEQLYEKIRSEGYLETAEPDFRAVHKWANEAGIDALIDESRSPIYGENDLPEQLRGQENEYACAMYVFLNYPQVFHWATELLEWENRTGKQHHFVGTGLPCSNETETLKELGEIIAEYYKKQSKGDKCLVDYYARVNPTRHFFFAYPQDRAKGYRAYDDNGRIVRRAIRPVFEVVFEYNPEDGDLAIHARGKKANEKMLEHFCTKVLGFKEVPDTKTEIFDLSCLKDPEFRFTEDAAMPAESITLKMVKFQLDQGAGQRVTLEANPCQGDNRQVEAMMQRSLIAHSADSSRVIVERAKIEIKFKELNMRKIGPITFTVGAPQYSTMCDDERSEMAKRYLRKWGILKLNEVKKDVEDAA